VLLGEFKQEFMKLNNQINMEIFGQGLRWQKVEISGDKIFIIASNPRVRALTAIDKQDYIHSKLTDIALMADYKERFIKLVDETLGLKILAHLKDYDPKTELSFSVSILEKNLEDLLKQITSPKAAEKK